MRTSLRITLSLIAVSCALGGVVAYTRADMLEHWLKGSAQADMLLVSGNIETHESIISFKTVQSRIVELPVNEGDRVQRGDLLAQLDSADYRQQVVIAESNLTTQTRQLEVAKNSAEAAQKTILSDEASVALQKLEFDRAQSLWQQGAVTTEAHDIAETALKQAQAQLARDTALAAAAEHTIDLVQANIVSARAALDMARIVDSYTTLRAPFDGVVLVRQAELGEVVSPGTSIVTLADINHVWLRAYVNEPDIGKIRLGQSVDVTTDSYPGKHYSGKLSLISEVAEFTPKSVETHAERVTLVYRIRIDLDNPTHELAPGLPADARLHLFGPGSK